VDVNSGHQNTINKNVNTMGLYWVLSLSSPYHWSHPVSYIITQNLVDSVSCLLPMLVSHQSYNGKTYPTLILASKEAWFHLSG